MLLGTYGKHMENTSVAWEPMHNARKTFVLYWHQSKTQEKHWFGVGTYGKRRFCIGTYENTKKT